MKIKRSKILRAVGLVILTMLAGAMNSLQADNGTCNGGSITLPFSDVAGSIFFCQIAEAYFCGLTNGSSATTYSPAAPVPREQMAAFITRTMDQSLKRSSRRGKLQQWWTQKAFTSTALTPVGSNPGGVKSDGKDLWVTNGDGTVTRIRGCDGKVLETWTGMIFPREVLVANGRIYVIGGTSPGKLYAIDPDQPPGNATLLTDVANYPAGIAYNGEYLMLSSFSGSNSGGVTIYHVPSHGKTTVTTGFSDPWGVIYDGNAFWVTDVGDNQIKRLNVNGQIQQSIVLGSHSYQPIFDGANIWIPCRDQNLVIVVKASNGSVIALLTGNGLSGPVSASFDGERVMIVNNLGNSVSLWRASDLSPLGSVSTGANTSPSGVCSDGRNFWITLSATNKLARF